MAAHLNESTTTRETSLDERSARLDKTISIAKRLPYLIDIE